MKKTKSAILAVIIIAAMLTACESGKSIDVPTEAQSAEPEVSSEEILTDTSSELEKSDEIPADLPSAVDLRNYNGNNYVTPVKMQAFGDCWSFGNAAAAESSYLYVNDLGVPAGEVNDKVNFSERYLGWYVFQSITEDDVKTGKVRRSQVGEGYDFSGEGSDRPNAVYWLGGALYSGSILFSSGFGPVDEMTEVDGKYPYAYSDKNIVNTEDYEDFSSRGDWSIPLNAQYRNPPITALLRNGNFLPSPASKDAEGNYKYNEDGVLAIKSEVSKGHAVAVAALVFGRMNYDNWAAYTPDDNPNHVITIVGYDDNYPKENFAVKKKDGEIDPNSIPPTDGAFIIKDSYGEAGGFDTKGSFYISYHDHTLTDPISFEFDKSDTVKYSDLNYDQYDLLMIGSCGYSDYESETKMANVFDAEEDEYLYQITYRTKIPNTSVHYEIYKDVQDGSPNSGTLLEEGDNSHYFGGSHKIDLKEAHELKKGEKYSVVLTMSYTNDEGKTTYTDVIPFAASRLNGAKANGVVNKGESYRFNGEKWEDLTDLRADFAKTAYEQNLKENWADDFKAHSAEEIAVDNYPIKAVLVPADKY